MKSFKNFNPSPYQRQIDLLQALIEDWYELDREERWNLGWALCDSCKLDYLPFTVRHEMFRAWKYYNGDEVFPVEGVENFMQPTYTPLNNPLRLNLAVHCLRYLKAFK